MVKALQAAQVQSVREIQKKADIKKTNKTVSIVIVTILVLLIVSFISYKAHNYYQETKFDFKETEMGISFYAKDMAIRDALATAVDSNIVVLSADTILNDSNSIADATEPIVLFTIMLTAKNKNTIIVINAIDSKNQLSFCSTNYGDIYTSVDVNKEECLKIIENATSIISIDIPNQNIKESRVNIYPLEKRIEIKPKTNTDMLLSTYLILKSNYPELEKVLSKTEIVKNKLAQNLNNNKVIDQNNSDSNN